jgi:hypothetical protein
MPVIHHHRDVFQVLAEKLGEGKESLLDQLLESFPLHADFPPS